MRYHYSKGAVQAFDALKISFFHVQYLSKFWNVENFKHFLNVFNEVSSAQQGCIYLIKNTVKTEIL